MKPYQSGWGTFETDAVSSLNMDMEIPKAT